MGRDSVDRQNRRKISFWKIAGQRELPDKSKEVDCRLVSKKKDGTIEEERGLSGHFLSIGHGEFTHESRLHKTIKILLWDKDEEFKIEVGIDSQIGRDLCNVILSRPDIDFINISCYNSKKNDEGKIFPRVGVRVNKEDKNLGWKHDYKAVIAPKIDKVMYKGKEENDATRANNFLLEDWIRHEKVLNEHARKIPANVEYEAKNGAPASAASSNRPAAEEQSLQDELNKMPDPRQQGSGAPPDNFEPLADDDLPF